MHQYTIFKEENAAIALSDAYLHYIRPILLKKPECSAKMHSIVSDFYDSSLGGSVRWINMPTTRAAAPTMNAHQKAFWMPAVKP